MAQQQLCDIQIHVNGQQTFFLNEHIIATYSGKLKKIIKHEKKRIQIKISGIEINEFPGGSNGFELVSRFCYNNGRIKITVSNVCLLYCCSIFLTMTEKVSPGNLLRQTETFLEGMFYWSWSDIITSLKSCESIFINAESCGLVQRIICALLAKIAQNSDMNFIASSSSSSSSPETPSGFRLSSSHQESTSKHKAWWFDDLTILPPNIIVKIIKSLGAYGIENNSLILTRFLLHYLKNSVQNKGGGDYGGIADTAVYGVILVGKTSFSCRRLFWVLRITSIFGLSKECRGGLEKNIGGMLDQATLDDLLVSGHDRGVYDVNLVLRLMRIFVNSEIVVSVQKMKKVGRLIDKYLGEISPDHNLKISKFLGVAESLPDFARDCFDGVYRAIDIYLESHPTLSFKERSKLCRCLNYEKLSLEACKDLAKNSRIPPNVAVQALMSQQPKLQTNSKSPSKSNYQMVLYGNSFDAESTLGENENIKLNLQRMQGRVVELEKVCKEMKGQMLKMVRHNVLRVPTHGRNFPRLC